jgi:hypothetical protein
MFDMPLYDPFAVQLPFVTVGPDTMPIVGEPLLKVASSLSVI